MLVKCVKCWFCGQGTTFIVQTTKENEMLALGLYKYMLRKQNITCFTDIPSCQSTVGPRRRKVVSCIDCIKIRAHKPGPRLLALRETSGQSLAPKPRMTMTNIDMQVQECNKLVDGNWVDFATSPNN